jgi:hypothetical protein
MAAIVAQRGWLEHQAQLAKAQGERLEAMKACVAAGISMAETGELFGVTRGYVSNVVHGRQGKGVAPGAQPREG